LLKRLQSGASILPRSPARLPSQPDHRLHNAAPGADPAPPVQSAKGDFRCLVL
jgi:hypothetical protein